MKLSELTYEYLESIGLSRVAMRFDASDALREVTSKLGFEETKSELAAKYGDVNLIINPGPETPWFDKIVIDDPRWVADHEQFCKEKLAWLNEFGCD